ncbi:MAG TPA: MBG domain-containing protein [Thermomicrobiaceae bacterium]|nr:MBG domain-containing protein [Thermomicrobiaceae bacterium]
MVTRPKPTELPARLVRPRGRAAITAVLIVTMLSMLIGRTPAPVAAAGTDPPELLNTNLLLSPLGDNDLYAATSAQLQSIRALEHQAIANTLADHGLAAGDASAVQSWARADALAELWGLVVVAIQTPAASRTSDQQNVVDWMTAVQQRETVLSAEAAGMEFVKWAGLNPTTYQNLLNPFAGEGDLQNFFINGGHLGGNTSPGFDPCGYRSPAPYQSEYTFWQGPDCNGGPPDIFQPQPPTYDQFVRWGAAVANPSINNPNFPVLADAVAKAVGLTGSLIGAAAAGYGISNSLTIANALAGTSFQTTFLPFAGRQAYDPAAAGRLAAQNEAAGESSAEAEAEADAEVAAESAEAGGEVAAASVAGLVAVVIASVAIAVIAIINLVQALQLPDQLAKGIRTAIENPPDVSTLIDNPSGISSLYALFIGAALPAPRYASCDNFIQSTISAQLGPCLNAPAVFDAGTASDPVFTIQAQGASAPTYSPSLTWKDTASGTTTTAKLHETWFIDRVSGDGLPATTVESLRISYTDWDGNEQTGWLFHDPSGSYRFQTVKALDPNGPPMNATTCVADQTCTAGPTIHLIGPDGTKYTVGVTGPSTAPTAPLIESATASNTNPTEGSAVTFTAIATSPAGLPLTYTWDFNVPLPLPPIDGFVPFICIDSNGNRAPCFAVGPFSGAQVQHTFPVPGTALARVTVTDSHNVSATQIVTVNVGDSAPVPGVDSLAPSVDPNCVHISPCNVWVVPAGSLTTLTGFVNHAGTSDTETVDIDWGDGTAHSHGTATLGTGLGDFFTDLSDLSFNVASAIDLQFAATHAYAALGHYTATVTATDGAGGTNKLTLDEVSQGTTALNWPDPAAITYGTPLGDTTFFNATATLQGSTPAVPGAFSYSAGDQPLTGSTVLPAGSYSVQVGFQPDDPVLYSTPGSVSWTLTVNPAPLTVTAPSPTMAYGSQTLPDLTAVSYDGFVNGERPGALGGSLSCALSDSGGTAVTLSASLPPGKYTVTCSGQTSSNYAITDKTGTLTIDPLITLAETGLPSSVPHQATLDGQTVNLPDANVRVAYGSSHSYSYPQTVIDSASGVVYFTHDAGFSGVVGANQRDTAIYQTASQQVQAALTSGGVTSAGVGTALTKQFNAVQADIAAGNTAKALADLHSFASLIRAQSGKTITADTAQMLLNEAQLTYTSLGGSGTV